MSSVVPKRVTISVVAWLLGLSALGWLVTARQASSMAGMTLGLGHVGRGQPALLTVPIFLGMWVGMLVAMMFPTVVPMVLAHRAVLTRRGEGPLPTLAFVGGYLATWTAAGLAPLGSLLVVQHLSAYAVESRWLAGVGGSILIVAGAYQFTNWKASCLRACRSPFSFVLTHDFRGGSRSALRAGFAHGAFCLGCCWALMAVLLVVGLMNLVWMVVLTLVFLAEKNWRRGVGLTRLAGSALMALGVQVAVFPGLLLTVSGAQQ